jgi:hypothetical protein
MAHYTLETPADVMREFDDLLKNSQHMIDDMVTAGAEVVLANVRQNMPAQLKKHATAQTLHLTRVYTTPSDDGRNCGVWFGGYMQNSKGKKTPIELVANMFEYGSKEREYPKHPFLRKSFHKREIERAMLKAQKKYIQEGDDMR